MLIFSIDITIIVVCITAGRVDHIAAVGGRRDQAIKVAFIILPIGVVIMLPAI